MNYLRKFRNRFITSIEIVSAMDEGVFLISPAEGFDERQTPAEYNGMYFTISSAFLGQESKETTSGTVYTISLKFSFPTFPGIADFMERFSRIAEIRLTTNTGSIIRLNRNDIAMNKPITGNFKTNLITTEFEASISTVKPFDIDE